MLTRSRSCCRILHHSISSNPIHMPTVGQIQILDLKVNLLSVRIGVKCNFSSNIKSTNFSICGKKETRITPSKHQPGPSGAIFRSDEREPKKVILRTAKKEHHLWQKRDSAGSGQKALHLVQIISGLPSEKEAVYGALDKWVAWETEFPLVAAAKALRILRNKDQWVRVIQVAKWMLCKGQGTTMGTYDSLLLAFDMERRVDEAEALWNMIVHTRTRSVPRRLFSRMISLYHHHGVPEKIIQVFADMEELQVKPDEDTLKRIAEAFSILGQEDKKILVLRKYQSKWKYIHFKGERVRVRRDS